MLIPLWLVPYFLLLGGGYWLGHAAKVDALGWVLGILAAIAYGWWRHRVRDNAWIDEQIERQWLQSELAELEARRHADPRLVRSDDESEYPPDRVYTRRASEPVNEEPVRPTATTYPGRGYRHEVADR